MQTDERQRLEELKLWRKAHGGNLSIDPSLVWPTVSLERLARNPDAIGEEMAGPDVRRWQSAEFGKSLSEANEALQIQGRQVT